MDNYYRIYTSAKNKDQHIIFSQGAQDKLSNIFWMNVTRNNLDARWKIVGKAQVGLSDKTLSKADYLSAFVSIPLFSEKFVLAMRDMLREEVDFFPCIVVSNSQKEYTFYIARTHVFLSLIDSENTDIGEKLSPLSPVIFKLKDYDFFIGRDLDRKSILVASEKFKSISLKMKF